MLQNWDSAIIRHIKMQKCTHTRKNPTRQLVQSVCYRHIVPEDREQTLEEKRLRH